VCDVMSVIFIDRNLMTICNDGSRGGFRGWNYLFFLTNVKN
jgi:hypothetical protein